MQEAVEELKEVEKSYRSSLPDITHHHFKLIYSPKLWSSILKSSIKSWKIRNIIDDKSSKPAAEEILSLDFLLSRTHTFFGKFWAQALGEKRFPSALWPPADQLELFPAGDESPYR